MTFNKTKTNENWTQSNLRSLTTENHEKLCRMSNCSFPFLESYDKWKAFGKLSHKFTLWWQWSLVRDRVKQSLLNIRQALLQPWTRTVSADNFIRIKENPFQYRYDYVRLTWNQNERKKKKQCDVLERIWASSMKTEKSKHRCSSFLIRWLPIAIDEKREKRRDVDFVFFLTSTASCLAIVIIKFIF